eukprot:3264733-Amphidinium_carterae.4
MRRQETEKRAENIRELYIILPECTLQQWMHEYTAGTIPPSYVENGIDEKHAWRNFHTRIESAISDLLSICI